MISKEDAKSKILGLVKEFSGYSKEELDNKSENQIKSEFIDPLFEYLGWDMRKDAERETKILKGRADYILKAGNQEVLVIEAKKTDVRLFEDEGRQAVSYAYHRKIKFSVLTNFKYLRIYHALSNIKNIEKNLLFWMEFKDFEKEFDKLWLLSKESFEKKEINKLLSKKDEKQFIPIDESILTDLLEIRKLLSNDLKKLRMYLTDEKIDEAIQNLIDRLIFIRSAEDRGLENQNFLLGLVKDSREGRLKKKLWYALQDYFRIFDKEYNSELFSSGLLEDDKNVFFDESTLERVIRILYFGEKEQQLRYLFDEIPGDLLGSIYEQYLGVVLRGTEKRVKLDLESGKRKKMGIYYTPSYIVDYIVKNTVGEYISNKTIDEILEINIVDPACGSGSFLIRAFQEICDRIEEKLKKGEKSEKYVSFKTYKEKLSLSQKSTIMLNCIYGIDLDEKAVELAQLNLLLKILEEEGRNVANKRLPNLLNNIKNGNSLIDDSKVAGDKAFNWHAQFPDVFSHGGFDVVIGNPPYIRIQTLSKVYKIIAEDYSKNYKSAQGNYDIYSLFVEKGIEVLKKNGKLGFILPNKFFISNYGKPLRNFLTEKEYLNEIVNFKDNQLFEGASTYTCLLFLQKSSNKKIKYSEINNMDKMFDYLDKIFNKDSFDDKNLKVGLVKIEEIKGKLWNFNIGGSSKVMDKLLLIKDSLGTYIDKMFQGIATSADSVYLVKITEDLGNKIKIRSDETGKEYVIEKEFTRQLIKGKDLERYCINYAGRILIFPYVKKGTGYSLLSEDELKNHKGLYNYFKELEQKIKDREHKKLAKSKGWFALTYPRSINLYDLTKIITPNSAFNASFCIDDSIHYYMTCGIAGGFAIILKESSGIDYKFLLAILNSKVMEFFNRSVGTSLRGQYYSYDPKIVKRYPFSLGKNSQQQKIISLVNQILELQKKYHKKGLSGNEKDRLEQQIKNINYEIDQEVYKLYGITSEEQKIIEESLK